MFAQVFFLERTDEGSNDVKAQFQLNDLPTPVHLQLRHLRAQTINQIVP
jgi:hypothetical protein